VLERHGDVFVFRMDSGENRFSEAMIADWNTALDAVEAAGSPAALVTTGSGKFYSNGLDLEHMLGSGAEHARSYLARVLAIYARVLTFPAITVAAINGHAFGAGGQIALAHDYRLARSGRGYFCMPEADLKAPLHPGMTALIRARLPQQTAHEMIATGRRYAAEDAVAAGIADRALAETELLPAALERAAGLAAKADPAMRKLKTGLYEPVLAALREPLAS
jgi:enoyl-CoA hydratase/carnithine racemase